MTEEKKKYDTNPLDTDFVRHTDEIMGWGATREFAQTPNERARRSVEAEAPTRRIEPSLPSSYPSVFVPPTPHEPPANSYGTAAAVHKSAQNSAPTSRIVAGINLPENIALIVPYLPFYIGAVAAALELFLVPRNEVRARFHAAQALALHLAVIVISSILGIVGSFVGSSLGGLLFSLATFIFFVISIVRVWKGAPHHIAPLDDATNWLNEKIEPRRK